MEHSITRRGFFKTAIIGAAATYLAPTLTFETNKAFSAELKSRVVMASHPNIVDASEQIQARVVRTTVDEMVIALTNTTSVRDAWMQLFPRLQSTDVIGIKVNCAERKLASHPEVVYAIAQSVTESLELNPNNIIIWDRSDRELKRAKYTLNTTDEGFRCFGTVPRFTAVNWMLEMVPGGGIGYDETAVIDVGKGKQVQLSKILTVHCTYLINIPVLKDHNRCGVTLGMKNHYGSINEPWLCHDGFCDPYIANLNMTLPIKDKTKLIVCDALFGMYKGGPLGAPQWINRQLLASTDPVALDYTGMTIIDQQRREQNISLTSEKAKYLRTATNLGLGTDDPQKIDAVEVNV